MSKAKNEYILQGGHNGLLQGDILSLTDDEAKAPIFKNKLVKVLKPVVAKAVKKPKPVLDEPVLDKK